MIKLLKGSIAKAILAIIILLLLIWGLISLYYYNQHVLTIKEFPVGEKFKTSDGIVYIHSIEIHNFESNYDFDLDSSRTEWFYNALLPKIPKRFHMTAGKIFRFYSKPYTFELSTNKEVAGKIMNLYGFYVSKKDKEEHFHTIIRAGVVVEQTGYNMTAGQFGSSSSGSSNIIAFHSRGKFFVNGYAPESNEQLIIKIKNRLIDEVHQTTIQPKWETKKYNFFKRPPQQYSYTPSKTLYDFINAARDETSRADEMLHPNINDFPWEYLNHDMWSFPREYRASYLENHLGYKDVFECIILFVDYGDSNLKAIAEQSVYMTQYDNQWRIIDIDPIRRE